MGSSISLATGFSFLLAQVVLAQTAPVNPRGPRPLYEVTIVSRTTKALNYGYLSAPTRIGFKGTPLLPDAQGEARIEPGRGATMIRAKFSNVPAPTRFGPQYLTYVLWSVSPEGRAQNLGELVLDASNKGKLTTSTPLQTFALLVTAEPYYSVRQPSDAVVMENVLVPDTIGKVEEVNATYELLPRKQFTYDPAQAVQSSTGKVSQEQYDAILAIYQAQNAIQIAESEQAQRYAPERLARARQLFEQAKRYPSSLSREIVATAREATQVAEDARSIAAKRAVAEQEAQRQALESAAAQKEDRAERERSRTEEASPPPQPVQTPVRDPEPAAAKQPRVTVDPTQFHKQDPNAKQNRRRLLEAVRGSFETLDSPRGIVVILPEREVGSSSAGLLRPVAEAVKPFDDLHIHVEAHSDLANDLESTQRQADMVRQDLIRAGVSPSIIVAEGYGNTQPRSAAAQRNRRVEIVIAGDPIGTVPTWDSKYRLTPQGASSMTTASPN